MDNEKQQSKGSGFVVKMLLPLLPALIFTQDWAWMTSNTLNGVAFVVFWALFIWHTWPIGDKNRAMRFIFRSTEIAFFMMPIAVLILMFVLGSSAMGSTAGAAHVGVAVGIALGGAFFLIIAFIIGLSCGFIMHVLASGAAKRSKGTSADDVKAMNWLEKNKKAATIVILIVLIIAAISAGQRSKGVGNNPLTSAPQVEKGNANPNSNINSKTANVPAAPQEPSPLIITKTGVSEDSIGTPVAEISVRNDSKKTIDAFKVHIKTFDAFGDPVNGFLSDNNYNGISQDAIAPGATENDQWKLYNFDTTKKISAEVYQIHFTDGTTWGK
jgi:Zn-dependent protease with chaperone function